MIASTASLALTVSHKQSWQLVWLIHRKLARQQIGRVKFLVPLHCVEPGMAIEFVKRVVEAHENDGIIREWLRSKMGTAGDSMAADQRSCYLSFVDSRVSLPC
jgi:hypothetical protein